MLVGLRLVLIAGVLLAAIALMGFLFTRNPKALRFAKTISAITLILVAVLGAVYFLERALLR
ncbi:MAG: hypothetical protein JNK75_15040 [Betaproteobacteria bacterium]|nr:hypothetical protein [Betaproteobacteria bacterium]